MRIAQCSLPAYSPIIQFFSVGQMMMSFLVWLLVLVLCWPLALLALVLYPLIWLLMLPLRLIGIGVEGIFELLRAIVLLPARVLGSNPGR